MEYVKKAPVVDGILNDECWEKAKRLTGFSRVYSVDTNIPYKTDAVLVYTEEALYLSVICEEPSIENLKATITEEDSDPISRDVKSIIKAHIDKEKKSWTIEMRIKFTDMGVSVKKGDEWGFNLCRNRCAGGKTEYSVWDFEYQGYNNPAGKIIFQ